MNHNRTRLTVHSAFRPTSEVAFYLLAQGIRARNRHNITTTKYRQEPSRKRVYVLYYDNRSSLALFSTSGVLHSNAHLKIIIPIYVSPQTQLHSHRRRTFWRFMQNTKTYIFRVLVYYKIYGPNGPARRPCRGRGRRVCVSLTCPLRLWQHKRLKLIGPCPPLYYSVRCCLSHALKYYMPLCTHNILISSRIWTKLNNRRQPCTIPEKNKLINDEDDGYTILVLSDEA